MNVSLFSPDYSHLTGLIRHLNDEELKELLDNEEKLKALIHDLKQVQDIEAEREILLTSNKSISEYNLSKKPILEDCHKQLQDTHKIALDLKNNLLLKKRKLETVEETQSPETLLALLQAATSEADGEAESIVDQFLKNEISVDDFLPKYHELRVLAHLRRIKSEKFTNLLQAEGNQLNAPPARPQRLRKPPVPPTSLPYPNPTIPNNIPIMPVRQAPTPPYGMPYQNPYQPRPFNYASPYPNYQMNPGYPPF